MPSIPSTIKVVLVYSSTGAEDGKRMDMEFLMLPSWVIFFMRGGSLRMRYSLRKSAKPSLEVGVGSLTMTFCKNCSTSCHMLRPLLSSSGMSRRRRMMLRTVHSCLSFLAWSKACEATSLHSLRSKLKPNSVKGVEICVSCSETSASRPPLVPPKPRSVLLRDWGVRKSESVASVCGEKGRLPMASRIFLTGLLLSLDSLRGELPLLSRRSGSALRSSSVTVASTALFLTAYERGERPSRFW
mmetsp:Transcript_48433/g.80490  ORF Transcript_48433/g.80490 Transcript_48433/m.80490 type:complete len:242 (-) Transcript_48433:1392-2117(-)